MSIFGGSYIQLLSVAALPFLSRDPKAIEIVQVILESILLRREKNMKDKDGKPIVTLPPKTASFLFHIGGM